MSDPNAIEQTAVTGAEMYISISAEKNSRSFSTSVKATVRWINWSDPKHGEDYLVPLGDGVGGPGAHMNLTRILDDLMRRGEAAVANSIARTNAALVAKGEGE